MSRPQPSDPSLLTARQAAERLGVSPSTLYAYVSRGLLRSEPAAPGSRERRYPRADVERLLARRERRRDPEKAIAAALAWGAPVLESAITLIEDGRLTYRGHDAVDLARRRTLEEVAELLWSGALPAAPPAFEEVALPASFLALDLHALEPFERLPILLPLAALGDLASHDPRPAAMARCGGRILRRMALAAAGVEAAPGRVAEILAAAWSPARTAAVPLLDAALVLAADHELNVSSFTARCVTSAGSTPYEAVAAGLAAVRGKRHGGLARRTETFLAELRREVDGDGERLPRALVRRLEAGETLPGFGHPLYPAGDPRGRALLGLLAERAAGERAAFVAAVAAAAEEITGARPTIDFGLAALVDVLELPAGASLALFALGRTAGWIGQAIEQSETGALIRPRARYVGPRPA